MKLLFKQRFFSWFDSYDIYNEDGQVIYQVEGKLLGDINSSFMIEIEMKWVLY